MLLLYIFIYLYAIDDFGLFSQLLGKGVGLPDTLSVLLKTPKDSASLGWKVGAALPPVGRAWLLGSSFHPKVIHNYADFFMKILLIVDNLLWITSQAAARTGHLVHFLIQFACQGLVVYLGAWSCSSWRGREKHEGRRDTLPARG